MKSEWLERSERLEQAVRAAERRARCWQLAAGLVVGIGLIVLPLRSGTAQNGGNLEARVKALETAVTNQGNRITALQNQNNTQATQISNLQTQNTNQTNQIIALQGQNTTQTNQIAALQTQNTAQTTQIAALQNKLVHVTRSGTDLFITGANVYLRNGQGSTPTSNNLGNLILGYNENANGYPRTGSHNLVVGQHHGWSSYGGIVAGQGNFIKGAFACVSGGQGNAASGDGSSVSGGQNNVAGGRQASVSGGFSNRATGLYSSVSGGSENGASGQFASVSGGESNKATGDGASVSGGSDIAFDVDRGWAGGSLRSR